MELGVGLLSPENWKEELGSQRIVASVDGRNGAGDLVNRFVTAMVALYRDEIAELLKQRDVEQAKLEAEHGEAGYEKASGVEVLSQIPIDLDAKIGAMELG